MQAAVARDAAARARTLGDAAAASVFDEIARLHAQAADIAEWLRQREAAPRMFSRAI